MHWSRWGDPAPGRPAVRSPRVRSSTPSSARRTPLRSTPPTCGSATRWRRAAGRARRRSSARSTCSPTTTPACSAPAASRRPTCCSCAQGDGSDSPDAVVRPGTHDEVQAVIDWCVERHVALVPFGGGTSVVGGLVGPSRGLRRRGLARPVPARPAARRRHRLDDRDPRARGSAVRRPRPLLAEHGLTLGHFPQSFEYASIGGFAVTRSSGQSSAGYGRFDSPGHGPPRRDAAGSSSTSATRRPTPPAPTCASGDGLRGRLRRGHRRSPCACAGCRP